MRKEKIYSLSSLYRENMDIYGYRFGKGEKAACIVGAMRGNEIQQMYIGALLVKSLKELEERGSIVNGNEILVIPHVNDYSINIESASGREIIRILTVCFRETKKERQRNGLLQDFLKK